MDGYIGVPPGFCDYEMISPRTIPHLQPPYFEYPAYLDSVSVSDPTHPTNNISPNHPNKCTFDFSSELPRRCPRCQGLKYNFTAYFHNSHIFHKPPHQMLGLIEESYILKNRLQSLLMTYVVHEVPQECLQDMQVLIERWGRHVDSVITKVSRSAGCQIEMIPLKEIQAWKKQIMMQLWDHISGVSTMDMSKGRWKDLVYDFRKLWERVWVECSYALPDEDSQLS